MGYNEGGGDSFNGGRKLRPLIPRLSSCPTAAVNTNSDHRFNMGISFSLSLSLFLVKFSSLSFSCVECSFLCYYDFHSSGDDDGGAEQEGADDAKLRTSTSTGNGELTVESDARSVKGS